MLTNELCDKFEAANPELVAACETQGIDWKSLIQPLWQQLGPLVMTLLAQMLQKWITPAPTPVVGPVSSTRSNE